jgi:hypothetical protein
MAPYFSGLYARAGSSTNSRRAVATNTSIREKELQQKAFFIVLALI